MRNSYIWEKAFSLLNHSLYSEIHIKLMVCSNKTIGFISKMLAITATKAYTSSNDDYYAWKIKYDIIRIRWVNHVIKC